MFVPVGLYIGATTFVYSMSEFRLGYIQSMFVLNYAVLRYRKLYRWTI